MATTPQYFCVNGCATHQRKTFYLRTPWVAVGEPIEDVDVDIDLSGRRKPLTKSGYCKRVAFCLMPHYQDRLSAIKVLTFHKDELTKARRTPAIPQLNCVGKPCRLFTPDVVQCVNVGGEGTDVHWKCEADLPETLRFGRVEVSCEGWSRSGDPNILRGSCALEYRLIHTPNRGDDYNYNYFRRSNAIQWFSTLISVIIGVYFLYLLYKTCWDTPRSRASQRPSGHSGGRRWDGWFRGFNNQPPPPPYSKYPTAAGEERWTPGFWTGLAAGGLAANLLGRSSQSPPEPRRAYDWERPTSWFGSSGSRGNDRGEGSSSGLGEMRRGTGYGTTNVR